MNLRKVNFLTFYFFFILEFEPIIKNKNLMKCEIIGNWRTKVFNDFLKQKERTFQPN